jgi:pimeloyl-ACP methyl ester carboxylesterase
MKLKSGLLPVAVLLCSGLVLLPAAGRAQLSREDAKCRSRVGKATRKLGTTLIKEGDKCHKKRLGGKLSSSVDCNSVAQMPGVDKVARAADRLTSDAVKHCAAASPPADNGYGNCVSPCASIAISDYASVGQCLACLVESGGEGLLANVLGAPTAPASGKAVSRCQGHLGKGLRKYTDTRMKVQQSCQYGEDQSVAGVDCLTDDPRGKMARGRVKAQERVARCSAVALSQLDSCSATIAGEQACVVGAAEAASGVVFSLVYPDVNSSTGYHDIDVPQADGSSDTMTIYAVSPDASVHGPGPYPVVVYGHGQNYLGVTNCKPDSQPTNSADEGRMQPLADAGYLSVAIQYRNRGAGAPGTGAIRFRDHWVFDTRGILAAAQWARTEHGSGSGDVAFIGTSMGTWSSMWAASTDPALADLKTGLTTRTVILAAESANHLSNVKNHWDDAMLAASPLGNFVAVVTAASFFADMASASMGMTEVSLADLAAGQPLGDSLRDYLTEGAVELMSAMYFQAVPAGADCGTAYGARPPACSQDCLLASYAASFGDINSFGAITDYLLPGAVAAVTYWDPAGGFIDPGAGVADPLLAALRAGSPAYSAPGLEAPRALSLLNEADGHYDPDARQLLVDKLLALGASPVGMPSNTAPECTHQSYLDVSLDCGINEIIAELDAAFP